MRLGKLSIKDRVFFKDVEFNFGHKGLTVVHGLNLNAGNDGNSNAAGKSFLFNTIQDLCYSEVLVGSRRDRLTTGEVSLELLKGKKVYTLVSKSKGKSYTTAILENGIDKGIREKAEVQAFLQKLIPANLSAYSTLCHIDSSIPHPIIRGDTAQRKKFFTDFFELDSTESLRKLIGAELSEINSDAKLLVNLKDRLSQYPDEETLRAARQKAKEVFAKRSAKKEELLVLSKAYNSKLFLREYLSENLDKLKNYNEKHTLAELKSKEKALRTELQTTLEQVAFQTELKAYNLNLKDWQNSLKDLGFASVVELEGEVWSLADKLKADRENRESLRDIEDEVARLDSKIELQREKVLDLEAHNEESATVCAHCGSVLTGIKAKDHREALLEKVQAAKVALKNLIAQKREVEQGLRDLAILSPYKREKLQDKLSKLRSIPSKPKRPAAIDEIEIRREPKVIQDHLTKLQDKIDQLLWTKSSLFGSALNMTHKERLKLLAAEDPNEKYLKLLELTRESELEVAALKDKLSERQALVGEIGVLEKKALNAEALSILSEAYGPKGIRKILINTVCQNLQDVLNKYAKTLFMEDYQFELEMETQFHILVHRKVKGKTLVSDVRRLSGAERSLFSLLLWCSLLSFVPKEKRPNFVVLDELDANMSSATLERFLSFIPKMLSVVDHVIVVTPKSEVRYEDLIPSTRYLTVVKKGAVAKIKEGKFTNA